jgi:hypothetical protein
MSIRTGLPPRLSESKKYLHHIVFLSNNEKDEREADKCSNNMLFSLDFLIILQ